MTEAATQERILRSATECFTRRGYKKTSIDSVAARARVAKGTVYLYCESKQDLFYQVVHRELRQWLADLSKQIDPRRPASELMLEMAAADHEFTEKRPLVRGLLFGMYHGLLPEWADRFEELRMLAHRHVIELLELGIKQGAFAADIDVEATARVIRDLHVAGMLLGHKMQRSAADVRRQRLAAQRLVLKGIESR
jgi:AcrR family transcriptional regulator